MITVLAMCLLACAPAVDQQSARQAPQGQPPAERASTRRPFGTPSEMGLQGYSVVLVVGDMQGGGSAGASDTVPAAARKALSDMQAFLPYKRYQLFDATWMLCCGMFRQTTAGRMRGPDERDLGYAIETLGPTEDGKLLVRFVLREGELLSAVSATASNARPGATPSAAVVWDVQRAELARQAYQAQKERDDAELQQRRAKQMHDVGTLAAAELEAATRRYELAKSRLEELERAGARTPSPAARGSLLDSTFSIAVGETVVIGTSRLKGDQALIALLTAAGKPGGAR